MTDGSNIDRLVRKALLDLLSDRIVERLRMRERSALVLLSGTDLGLRSATAALARLCATGWRLELRSTADAVGLIGADQMRELAGGVDTLPASDAPIAAAEIDTCLMRNSLVLVPTLNVALAARVGSGLTDSAVPALFAGAIERGKRIIVARDGCCPSSRDRAARGLQGNQAYQAMLAGKLERLEAFGAELVWASQLATAVTGAQVHRQKMAGEVAANKRHVFGWNEAKLVGAGTLSLAPEVLITPLAAEELRARGVRLVRE